MTDTDGNNSKQEQGPVGWGYVIVAAIIFGLTWILLCLLWQVPQVFPQLGETGATVVPPTATRHALPSPTPGVRKPTIDEMTTRLGPSGETLIFELQASVAPHQQIAQVVLWYDTVSGQQLQRTRDLAADGTTITYQLYPAQEGLTMTLTSSELVTDGLGYWWQVRDTAGDTVRAGGTVTLPPEWQSWVTTPTVAAPHLDFSWGVSETRHFALYYVPGSAAERDLSEIGALAEDALSQIQSVLEVDYDEQMDVYLVPRVFWQGGAAYADKVQLISYLDRNYTAIETWSYFTHEGTHALAQDLKQYQENKGGPDGVLVEGLAVWASGGHYRREPIDMWAAAIAGSETYITLDDLRAGPFYDFQHEISYLQAASFVNFLVEQYGLDKLKTLYGEAVGEETLDEALVERLYEHSYDELEAQWLDYLAGLSPSSQEARAWELEVRAFDLMRRYEVELDSDARLLPNAPPEWQSDTLKVFLQRSGEPVNIVLETALIAGQDRLHTGDLDGASALFDDIEAAIDADGQLVRPSLLARQAILETLAAQDRAILVADTERYLETVTVDYAAYAPPEEVLTPPFIAFDQEIVRLDIGSDGQRAEATVLVHAQMADGAFEGNGQLFVTHLDLRQGRWLVSGRDTVWPALTLPTIRSD